MSRPPFASALLAMVATTLAAAPAHAAEPKSSVDKFEWSLLKGAIVITPGSTLEQGTVNAVVDPKLPAWTVQGGKLIVPSCTASLVGPLKVSYTAVNGHDTSALHWKVTGPGGTFHEATVNIVASPSCGAGAKTTNCNEKNFEKTWQAVDVPMAPGTSVFNLQAWTSKQGEKSKVKSGLLKVSCTEAPKVTIPAQAKQPVLRPPKPAVNVPGPMSIASALEVKALRLDLGFPDANAVQWFKGQPATKEILLHEITGPGSEPGGSKWGVATAVTAGGTTVQSRGVDSCRSPLKVKGYFVHVRNNGLAAYNGGTAVDLKATTTGPNGTFTSNGDLGPVAPNVEAVGAISTANQGVVFFTSGTYNVKADLVAPAASPTPANNTGQVNVTIKCKALNATTWQ